MVNDLSSLSTVPRAGYTLPVFACAAAIAAFRCLQSSDPIRRVAVDLLEPAITVAIEIEQVAPLQTGMALAITRSDPGDNLDLTSHTPVWAVVERIVPLTVGEGADRERLILEGGEGIGRLENGDPAIYRYARRLLAANLEPLLQAEERIRVRLILPEGRSLAKRTSNEAFGVVEGLSLLGTTGISEPLSAPGQLQIYRESLQAKHPYFDGLVFCVGENGLDFARRLGVVPDRLVKTANWVGPLLVEAAAQGVQAILLFGYHGKLIKLAGGIFHTHHYLADGRLEVLTAHAANAGLPAADVQTLFACETAEDGLNHLRQLDATTGSDWVAKIYGAIAHAIDQRSQAYIQTHSDRPVSIGCLLFDRHRNIVTQSQTGAVLLEQVCQVGYNG